MTITTFDAWLRELAAAGKLAERGLKIDRGLPFGWTFAMGGDRTGDTIESDLRAHPDAGAVVESFTATNEGYDAETGLTTFKLALLAADTATLPADTTGEATARLAWDVILTPSGGAPMRLMGGVATVLGEVTDV